MSLNPYHVYMDLDVINNDYTSATAPQLRFEETRNNPYLDGDAFDYFCCILRFTIQTGNSLPVFIPRVQVGQSDRNLTIYKITISKSFGDTNPITVSGSAYLRYWPEDETAPLAEPPTTAQDTRGSYYHVYNYQHFIRIVNEAFDAAVADMRSKVVSNWLLPWSTTAVPHLEWDNTNCTTTLYSESNTTIKFNSRLYELFVGLPAHRISEQGEETYRLRTTKVDGLNTTKIKSAKVYTQSQTTTVDTTFITTGQEISSIAIWNPIASIVFSSGSLPVLPTHTSVPKDIGTSSNNLVGGGNNSNLTTILSDFSIAVSPTNQYRPIIDYAPSSEYRLMDMNSSMNLNRIDIVVYWKDHFGILHPVRLRPGCSAHAKILFRRKDFDVMNC